MYPSTIPEQTADARDVWSPRSCRAITRAWRHRTSRSRAPKVHQIPFDPRHARGGNSTLLEVHMMRHLAAIESLHSHGGTEGIKFLVIGRDITRVGVFG